MNSSNNENNTTTSELVIEKPTKTGWYQALKTDPILFNVYKEYLKQKYLDRKNKSSEEIAKPKRNLKSSTKTPEKAKYKHDYYIANKAKYRDYQRDYYHRKIKGSARVAPRKNKELTREAKQQKQEYQRQYRETAKELLKFAREATKAKKEPENNI